MKIIIILHVCIMCVFVRVNVYLVQSKGNVHSLIILNTTHIFVK